MDTIRTKIADKVLEISCSGSSEIKIKLDKINRFRDFTDACQILIQKYHEIEIKFLRMIDRLALLINLETIAECDTNPIEDIESKIEFDKNSNLTKENIKKGLLVLGIIAAIIILIFIVTFIINNCQLVLWILGGCIVATGVAWFLLKRNKNK